MLRGFKAFCGWFSLFGRSWLSLVDPGFSSGEIENAKLSCACLQRFFFFISCSLLVCLHILLVCLLVCFTVVCVCCLRALVCGWVGEWWVFRLRCGVCRPSLLTTFVFDAGQSAEGRGAKSTLNKNSAPKARHLK